MTTSETLYETLKIFAWAAGVFVLGAIVQIVLYYALAAIATVLVYAFLLGGLPLVVALFIFVSYFMEAVERDRGP